MTNIQKNVIFWLGVAFLVVISIFFLVSINQKLNTATTTNTASFSGEGKVTAKPDVAVANLSIITEAVTSKKAQEDNSAKSQKVIDYLKGKNIEDKDIKTTNYNIYPVYNYPRNETPKITGYRVDESIQVKIRNLEDASSVLDGVVTAGVNQVGNLNFQIDDPEDLKDQAREKAIADAKDKAENLKKQLGIKLGRIINFVEGSNGYPIPMYDYSAKTLEAGGMGGGPPLPAGENEITVNITITYQIK